MHLLFAEMYSQKLKKKSYGKTWQPFKEATEEIKFDRVGP